MSSLNLQIKASGGMVLDYDNLNIHRCLVGACAAHCNAPRQAALILSGQLAFMLLHLSDSSDHTVFNLSFKAAILTSFCGLLRKSHITNPDTPLLREDFPFH